MKNAKFLETVSTHVRQFGPRITPELLFYGESKRYSAIGSLGLRYWQSAVVRTGLEDDELQSYFLYAAESDSTSGMFIARKQAPTPLEVALVISDHALAPPHGIEAKIYPEGQVSVTIQGLQLAEITSNLHRI